VIRPGSGMPEQIVALSSDLVSRMANNDTVFIKQNSPLFEKGLKALAGRDTKDIKLIHLKGMQDIAFRQRRLINAGYVFFLIRHSSVSDILSDQIRHDLAVTDMDISSAASLLAAGQFSLFYKDIRALSKEDRKSFDAGYVLGQVFYADTNGLLDKNIISRAEKELAPLLVDGMREYITTLAPGAGDRATLRVRVKKSLLAM
jgi:hypothetical protein